MPLEEGVFNFESDPLAADLYNGVLEQLTLDALLPVESLDVGSERAGDDCAAHHKWIELQHTHRLELCFILLYRVLKLGEATGMVEINNV